MAAAELGVAPWLRGSVALWLCGSAACGSAALLAVSGQEIEVSSDVSEFLVCGDFSPYVAP